MTASSVFLVGAERSGSTMLRLMLSHHPLVSFGGEFEFVVDAIGEDGLFPRVEQFIEELGRSRVFAHFGAEARPQPDFPSLAKDLLEQKRHGRDIVGATVHRHIDRLLRVWPDARFIHLVRDGRDVALSTIPMGWAGNAYCGISSWVTEEEAWARLSASITPDRQITVHYEKLLADPPAELARICTFLDIAYDPTMLDYDRDSTYAKPNTRSIGNWRSADPAEIAAAESIAAPWLEANGYELSRPVSTVSRRRDWKLKLQSRLAVARFRRRRYSTPLWVADMVVRRIGSQSLRARLQKRIDAIDDRHVK